MWDWNRRRSSGLRLGVTLTGFVAYVGCSAADSMSRDSGSSGQPTPSSGGSVSTPPDSGTPPSEPPEQETESAYQLPVLSGRWVFSANPESGWVAAIDTRDSTVALTRAGARPSQLAALPPGDAAQARALVLNAGTSDAQRLELTEAGLEAGPRLETHAGANAIAVSPSGRFALVWTDSAQVGALDPLDTLQDLTVLSFSDAAGTATRQSVGYRPKSVVFDREERRAFVVCERTISIVELTDEPHVSRDLVLPVPAGQVATDVSLTPDGLLAVYRVAGGNEIHWLSLESRRSGSVRLARPVTDLDLMQDGARALAIARGTSSRSVQPASTDPVEDSMGGAEGQDAKGGAAGAEEALGGAGSSQAVGGAGGASTGPEPNDQATEIALLDLTQDLENSSAVTRVQLEEAVGSVSVSSLGSRAVLYTNASDLPRVTILDIGDAGLDAASFRTEQVRAPVRAVFVSPDDSAAIAILRELRGNTETHAFALLPLEQALPAKIQVTEAAVTGVAFGPPPTEHAILISDSAVSSYVAHFPALRVDTILLANRPQAAGIVAEEGLAYVLQRHAEGQLGLIELATGGLRNLTGFELSGGVRNER